MKKDSWTIPNTISSKHSGKKENIQNKIASAHIISRISPGTLGKHYPKKDSSEEKMIYSPAATPKMKNQKSKELPNPDSPDNQDSPENQENLKKQRSQESQGSQKNLENQDRQNKKYKLRKINNQNSQENRDGKNQKSPKLNPQ